MAFDAVAVGNELLLGGLCMHKQDVAVAVGRVSNGLPGADRDDAGLDAGLRLE